MIFQFFQYITHFLNDSITDTLSINPITSRIGRNSPKTQLLYRRYITEIAKYRKPKKEYSN